MIPILSRRKSIAPMLSALRRFTQKKRRITQILCKTAFFGKIVCALHFSHKKGLPFRAVLFFNVN